MNLTDAVVGLVKAVSRHGRIERLLEQLGWSIDGRKGNALMLNFSSPRGDERSVFIANGNDPVVAFVVYSDVRFDSTRVPSGATNFALIHNDRSPFGKWEGFLDDGDLLFRLSYAALGDGLSPEAVETICKSMLETADVFDEWMRREGYLR